MPELWDIAVITRRTGLTSRALRHYEARGLIAPLRSGSGRRLYGAPELERIHQIITLKRAGLSLQAIGAVLAHRGHNLASLIDAQLEAVEAESARLAAMRALLMDVKARLVRQETLDPATLCELIHESQRAAAEGDESWRRLTGRYMDQTVQQQFERAFPTITCEFTSEEYDAKWRDLGARIGAALPLDPTSETALGFVREWMTLLAPFSAIATPEMWQGARSLYDDVDTWRGEDGIDPGFDGAVWRFISAASTAARERGADIGPVPAWFEQRTFKES